jgi:hypothetical protein
MDDSNGGRAWQPDFSCNEGAAKQMSNQVAKLQLEATGVGAPTRDALACREL